MSIEKKKRKLRSVSIGKILTKLRKKKKMKQTEIASILGMSPSLLNKFERDQRLPSMRIVKQLAQVYQVEEKPLLIICLMDHLLKNYGQEDFILEAMSEVKKYY